METCVKFFIIWILQNPRIYFDKTIKQQEKGNQETIFLKWQSKEIWKLTLPKVATSLKLHYNWNVETL